MNAMDRKRSVGVTIISGVEILFSLPKFLSIFFIGSLSSIFNLWNFICIFLIPFTIFITGMLTYKLNKIGRQTNIILGIIMLTLSIPHIINPIARPTLLRSIGSSFAQFLEPTYGFLPFSFDFYIIKTLPILSVILIYFFTRPKVKEQFK